MFRTLTACGFSGLALALLSTSAFAQDHAVGDWQGGKLNDGFGSCAFAKQVAEGVDIILYAASLTPPRLEVRKADWGLYPTQSMQVTLALDGSEVAYEAEQARKLDIVQIKFGVSDGGSDIIDAIGQAQDLSIAIDGAVYATNLDDIDDVVAALESCVDGRSSSKTATRNSFDLGNALSQLPTGRIAGFTCLITTGQMYGILTRPAEDPAEAYAIEMFEDGSINFQGGRVEAGHREYASYDPSELEGAAYDVRALSGASASYQLPSTFGDSGNQFSAFMQDYTKGIGEALLGNRQRWLVINIPQDIVAFSDINANGNLENTVMPECYRTQ